MVAVFRSIRIDVSRAINRKLYTLGCEAGGQEKGLGVRPPREMPKPPPLPATAPQKNVNEAFISAVSNAQYISVEMTEDALCL